MFQSVCLEPTSSWDESVRHIETALDEIEHRLEQTRPLIARSRDLLDGMRSDVVLRRAAKDGPAFHP